MIVAMATTPPIQLKEGDKAPAFQSATQAGGQVALKDFKGKHVVLFFYPKDDTPG
jgi:peroxiredoxin Q/BCP